MAERVIFNMNRQKLGSIIIRTKLFERAYAEHYRKKLSESDFSRGMYCSSEINCRDKGSVLCVFLSTDGAFIGEVMLNSDYGRLHERILDKVKHYAAKFSSHKVFIGHRFRDSDDIEYLVSEGILISDALSGEGIELLGYYITDGTSYENILPERG